MTQPTSKKLADALAAEPCAPEHEARRAVMVQGALHDHYHDYFGHSATPTMDLYTHCMQIGLTAFAARVLDDEFGASDAEGEAWAGGPDGQQMAAMLTGKPATAPDGPICGEAAPQQLGDAPIEDAYRETMTMVVRSLDQLFNGQVGGKDRKTGFVLLVFPFGDGEGRCNYASNGADRKDIVTMMKEQIKRFEGQPDGKGRA